MKKHWTTFLGIVLALAVAFGVAAWDQARRDQSASHRAIALATRCEAERSAAVTAAQANRDCGEFYTESHRGADARTASALMTGGAAGLVVLLLFLSIRRMVRKSRAAPAA